MAETGHRSRLNSGGTGILPVRLIVAYHLHGQDARATGVAPIDPD